MCQGTIYVYMYSLFWTPGRCARAPADVLTLYITSDLFVANCGYFDWCPAHHRHSGPLQAPGGGGQPGCQNCLWDQEGIWQGGVREMPGQVRPQNLPAQQWGGHITPACPCTCWTSALASGMSVSVCVCMCVPKWYWQSAYIYHHQKVSMKESQIFHIATVQRPG